MSLFMIQFVGWAMCLGLVLRWEESIEMWNTWDRLIACVAETGVDVSSDFKMIL